MISVDGTEVEPIFYLDQNPLSGFGWETVCSCPSSAQFRQNPVRDFAICASKGFCFDAEADATDAPKPKF